MPAPSLNDCALWTAPEAALEHGGAFDDVGPTLGEHPNLRAMLQCRCCGHRYLYDFFDAEEWGGVGEGRVLYLPVPEALGDDDAAQMTAAELEQCVPRLLIRAYTPFDAAWIRE